MCALYPFPFVKLPFLTLNFSIYCTFISSNDISHHITNTFILFDDLVAFGYRVLCVRKMTKRSLPAQKKGRPNNAAIPCTNVRSQSIQSFFIKAVIVSLSRSI